MSAEGVAREASSGAQPWTLQPAPEREANGWKSLRENSRGAAWPSRVCKGSRGASRGRWNSASATGQGKEEGHSRAGEQMPRREGEWHVSSLPAPNWVHGEELTAPGGNGNEQGSLENQPLGICSVPSLAQVLWLLCSERSLSMSWALGTTLNPFPSKLAFHPRAHARQG